MFVRKGIGLLLLIFAAPGFAQQASQAFKKADKNSDGYIDAGENAAVISAAFREQDANHDGQLDLAEISNYLQTHVRGFKEGERVALPPRALDAVAKREVQTKDKNGDGKISEAEYTAAAEAEVQRLDRDKDGRISQAEFPARSGQ